VVGGSTVHFAVPGWSSAGAGRANQELPDLTATMDRARRSALGRMTDEAERLRADGVVGVSLQHQVERIEERRTRGDVLITFHILGTAIAGRPEGGGVLAVTPTLGLRAPTDRGARR
jgi:uncharacterized protein YbjQ (UPF0145 family)